MPASSAELDSLATRYHRRVVAVAEEVARAAAAAIEIVDPDQLRAGFQALVPAVAELVTIGQRQAQTLAAGYFREATRIGTGETLYATPDPELVGVGFHGKDLAGTVAGAPAAVWRSMRTGKSAAVSMHYGRLTLARTAQGLIVDAATNEIRHQAGEAELGWHWRSRGTCGACMASDTGTSLPAGTELNRHPFCVCVAEPAVYVKQGREFRGYQRFRQLTPEEQDALLGPRKAELIRDKAVPFDELAAQQELPNGDVVVVERDLDELLELAGVGAGSQLEH